MRKQLTRKSRARAARSFLAVLAFAMFAAGCSKGGEPVAQKPANPGAGAANSPAVTEMKALALPPGLKSPEEKSAAPEGASAENYGALPEGSGSGAEDHPNIDSGEKVQREVLVPEEVNGKWKAVKLLVRNKKNETLNEMKTVDLGSSFTFGKSGTKVTVGPFLPNFVMSQSRYTSMNNQTLNPAVQLVVEENGKILYKGWAFAKYPTLYAFEHEVYGLQLMDFIPAPVS